MGEAGVVGLHFQQCSTPSTLHCSISLNWVSSLDKHKKWEMLPTELIKRCLSMVQNAVPENQSSIIVPLNWSIRRYFKPHDEWITHAFHHYYYQAIKIRTDSLPITMNQKLIPVQMQDLINYINIVKVKCKCGNCVNCFGGTYVSLTCFKTQSASSSMD